MPRKKLITTDLYPYHITNRSNNKEYFYLPNEILWPMYINKLQSLKDIFKCKIHAFVLMTNHYHLILSTTQSNLAECMQFFNGSMAREANKISKRINHFYGARYKWCIINSEKYYWNAVKYVFRNPIEAGICYNVEDYLYSSLNHPTQSVWDMIDFFHDKTKKINIDLDWLNTPNKKEQTIAIPKIIPTFRT